MAQQRKPGPHILQLVGQTVRVVLLFAFLAAGILAMWLVAPCAGADVVASSITSQPQSLTVTNGDPASFNVTASGTAPLSYQWQKNGANLADGGNISGSDSNTLTLSTTTTNDVGNYTVVVANAPDSVTSSVATLTLSFPNLLQNPGFETGDFTGWIVGGNSPTSGVATAGMYIPAYFGEDVIVHSGSYAAYAAVDTEGTHLSLSQTVPVVPGATYDIGFWMGFGGQGTGDGGSSIYVNGVWQHDVVGHSTGGPSGGYEFWDFTWTAPTGTTTATVQFNLAASGTGSVGVSFDDFLFMRTASSPPSITSQPQSLTVTNGAPASFSVTASGTAPLFYRWQKDRTNLLNGGTVSGANSNTVRLSTTTTNDAGDYTVIVSNAYAGVTSSAATLTALPPPPVADFSASPTNGMAPLTVTFTNASTGSITNSFWDFGDSATSNTTAASLAHTYNTAGSNTVQLIVSGLGGVSTNTQADYIVVTLHCDYALSPTNVSVSVLGGSNTVSVTTSTNLCAWTAVSNNDWIQILGGGSATGNTLIAYNVLSNATNTNPRIGTITIAGQTFTVTQPGNALPQVNIPAVAPITLPVSSVNLNASVTDDGQPYGMLSTCWSVVSGPRTVSFANICYANTTATFSTNGTYVLRLTANDGALPASGDVTVIVNVRPTITAPPAVTNQLTTVGGNPVVPPGDPVAFSISVTDADGNPLSCLWDFGDAQTSLDWEPSHVFSNCGPHEVTVVVSDGIAPVTNSLVVSVACPFSELPKPVSLKMKSNFAPGKLDTATFKASLDLPVGFSVTNTPVSLEVAGAVVPFTMNAKGRAVNAFSTITLSHKGKATSMVWQVSAKLKGNYDAVWQNYGLTNATVRAVPITVPVLLLFDTPAPESFFMEKPLLYKATAGKSGTGQ